MTMCTTETIDFAWEGLNLPSVYMLYDEHAARWFIYSEGYNGSCRNSMSED
jgi:hypothetical protein